jgi:DSF synthase
VAHDVAGQSPIAFRFSAQLSAEFHRDLGAMWLHWNPQPRPCFNELLLAACYEYALFLQACGGRIEHDGQTFEIRSSILNSDVPGVFNLGGDLDLFTELIAKQDRTKLMRYGIACVEVVYQNYIGYELPLTTVSLVQGECLGGGFEAALSSNVVIAERHARFGFPEVLFNLFPGMGAVSFLIRRGGEALAREVAESGAVYSADDMFKRGLIDEVVDEGEGPAAVRDYLHKNERTIRNLVQVRRRVRPIHRRELDDIVNLWVDAALRINPRDLRLMAHLVNRQDRLTTHPHKEQSQ